MNYQENKDNIKLSIVDEFGGEKKVRLMAKLNLLLKYQRLEFKHKIEENLDKI